MCGLLHLQTTENKENFIPYTSVSNEVHTNEISSCVFVMYLYLLKLKD